MHAAPRALAALIALSSTTTVFADGVGTGPNSWIGYVFGSNQATASGSAVAAGTFNLASGQGAFVGAGSSNQSNGISSLVIGGFDNRAVAIDSLVGAGAGNRATGARSVVVGGGYNLASGQFSFIGGGGRDGTVATPAGTSALDHVAAGNFSVIAGGQGNRIGTSGAWATIIGGIKNSANGLLSSVLGGQGNVASGFASVALGGDGNVASGDYSLAAGFDAKADQTRCFVFAGWSTIPPSAPSCLTTPFVVRFFVDHGFSVDYQTARADGGGTRWVHIGNIFAGTTIGTWTGGFLSDSGVWTNNSDAARKTDFEPIDVREVLDHVASMPIKRWRYDVDDASVRHIGPTAQDFHAAFALGPDDKHIGTVDADGVALAAIQGLHTLVQELRYDVETKDAQIATLVAEGRSQREQMAELRRSVELLLARSSQDALIAQR